MYVSCVSLARKPGRMHTNGNLPSVRASVGLAAQGSNVSYGSGLSPTYFSLFIHEIKKCILVRDTIDQDQLKNQRYLIRFGHTKALLFSKKDHILAKIPVLGNLTHI